MHFDKPGDESTGKPQPPTLWAIGGGKGGVGKSSVTANLGVALAVYGLAESQEPGAVSREQ